MEMCGNKRYAILWLLRNLECSKCHLGIKFSSSLFSSSPCWWLLVCYKYIVKYHNKVGLHFRKRLILHQLWPFEGWNESAKIIFHCINNNLRSRIKCMVRLWSEGCIYYEGHVQCGVTAMFILVMLTWS